MTRLTHGLTDGTTTGTYTWDWQAHTGRTPDAHCPRPDKRIYPDRATARAALTAMNGQHTPTPLQPYHCTCGAWHLGNPPPDATHRANTRNSRAHRHAA